MAGTVRSPVGEGCETNSSPRQFGDLLSDAISWTAGGECMHQPIRVAVQGTGNAEDAFECPSEIFLRAARDRGGEPLFSPPPFAAPCTDGLLIIYILRRRSPRTGRMFVHGCYIRISRDLLERDPRTPIASQWFRAKKPTDMNTMLQQMRLTEPRPSLMN